MRTFLATLLTISFIVPALADAEPRRRPRYEHKPRFSGTDDAAKNRGGSFAEPDISLLEETGDRLSIGWNKLWGGFTSFLSNDGWSTVAFVMGIVFVPLLIFLRWLAIKWPGKKFDPWLLMIVGILFGGARFFLGWVPWVGRMWTPAALFFILSAIALWIINGARWPAQTKNWAQVAYWLILVPIPFLCGCPNS